MNGITSKMITGRGEELGSLIKFYWIGIARRWWMSMRFLKENGIRKRKRKSFYGSGVLLAPWLVLCKVREILYVLVV